MDNNHEKSIVLFLEKFESFSEALVLSAYLILEVLEAAPVTVGWDVEAFFIFFRVRRFRHFIFL